MEPPARRSTQKPDKEEIAKNNSIAFFADGVLFQAGLSFVEASSVISVLVYILTESASMAGLVQVVFTLGMTFGKVVNGARIGAIKNIPGYIAGTLAFSRLFLIAAAILLFVNISDRALSIVILMMYFTTFFFQGTTIVPWQDIYARTMTPRYRSTVLGYRQAFGGLAGILSSVIVQRILAYEGISFKMQYAIIIVLGAVVMSLAAVPLSKLKEYGRPQMKSEGRKEGIINLVKRAPKLFGKHKYFTHFTIIRALDMVLFTVITFVIIASKDLLNMTSAQIGVIVVMRTVGRTLGGFSSGFIAKRLGEKSVIMTRISALGLLALGGAALCFIPGIPVFVSYLFAALSGFGQSMMMGYMLYMLYCVQSHARADCITLNSLVLIPFTFSSYIAGLVIDAAGYLPYFIAMLIMSVVLLGISARVLLPKKKFEQIACE